jgi:hypothetical protein
MLKRFDFTKVGKAVYNLNFLLEQGSVHQPLTQAGRLQADSLCTIYGMQPLAAATAVHSQLTSPSLVPRTLRAGATIDGFYTCLLNLLWPKSEKPFFFFFFFFFFVHPRNRSVTPTDQFSKDFQTRVNVLNSN